VISDRKKDVIITGGENVSSIEVEDCLFSTRRSPRPR
jgi:fatty-acyl-CoA synthase